MQIPTDWKHWVWIADIHSGATTGLTPSPNNVFQEALLERYKDAIEWNNNNFREPDVVVVVGDPTEGVDPKLDVDNPLIISQYQQSADLISMWNAKEEYIIITGTKVHTHLQHQELEEVLKDKIQLTSLKKYNNSTKVSVRRKLKTTINEWFLTEARHFVSRSIIPHGRATAPMRSQMWNVMNSALDSYLSEQPAHYPQLLVFGHTHYYQRTDNAWGSTCILPSWKAIGDKYGDEICDGHIDVGCVVTQFSGEDEKRWNFEKRLYQANVVSRTESR